MTIRFSNGQALEGILLSRTDTSMRVAIQDSDDVQELNQIDGTWISDSGEAVEIEFAWARRGSIMNITEEDCVCPQDLAARLIQVLFASEEKSRNKVMAAGN